MKIESLVKDYLPGVSEDEIEAATKIALANKIRELKMSIAETVVLAQMQSKMGNLEASNAQLKQAKKLKTQLIDLQSQWNRLTTGENTDVSDTGDTP